MPDQLTRNGTITDLMSDRRDCPECGNEGTVERVDDYPNKAHPTTFKIAYLVRCPKGHSWIVDMPKWPPPKEPA